MFTRAVNITFGLALLLAPLVGRGQPNGWHYNAGGRLLGVKSRGNNIWVVGAQGLILHSTDRGETWNSRESGTTVDLYGVSFIDDQTGWVVGDYGRPIYVLHTTDGGVTWQTQTTITSFFGRGVCFVDSSHGWICGTTDTVHKTTDGGATWTKIRFNQLSHGTGIVFTDTLRGFISTDFTTVLKTTDGGQTWISKPVTDGLFGIDMLDSLRGWATGGSIFKTTNGWETSTFQWTGRSLTGISIGDSLSVWSVGYGHRIVKTSNGGSIWVTDTSQTQNDDYYGVDGHLQLTNITVVGDGGAIIRSTNAGNSWRVIRNVDIGNTSLLNVAFRDSNQGWAVGTYGVITHTTNGGTVWSLQNSGTQNFLNGVDFPTSQRGWVCSWNGDILTTADAGSNWAPQTSNTTYPLFSIDFLPNDSLYGWAIGGYWGPPEPPIGGQGDKGTRRQGDPSLKTAGAGKETRGEILRSAQNDTLPIWGADPTPNPSPKALGEGRYDFWKYPWRPRWDRDLRPEETALTTPYRTITRTTNGGALWIAQNSSGQVPLYGVSFVSRAEGWACGDPQGGTGVILHTTDSGATWQSQNSNRNQFLNWIQFRDPLNGWCVGGGGAALWTTDGGNTWNQGISGTTAPLWSCAFYDNQNGFACGDNGLLIMTNDGGRNWTPDTSNKAHANLTALRALDSLHVWAVGSYGMVLGWRLAGTSGVETRGQGDKETRANISIKAWPNPFVSFARVPGREKERFALYDVSGRRVGTYTGERIGADIGSGVYFLMLEGKEAGPTRIVKVK